MSKRVEFDEIAASDLLQQKDFGTSSDEDIIVFCTVFYSLVVFLYSIPPAMIEYISYDVRSEKNRTHLDVSEEFANKIAKAGMVVVDDTQVVKCISCPAEFRNWNEADDDPRACHARLEPNCLYILFIKSIDAVETTVEINPVHRELFFELKRFVQSSKFEVAKELDYEAALLVALATRKKVTENATYGRAGDLVLDADDVSSSLFDMEQVVQPVLIIDGFYELLMEAVKRWSRLQKPKHQPTQSTTLHSEDRRVIHPVRQPYEPKGKTMRMENEQKTVTPAPHQYSKPAAGAPADLKTETERLYYSSRCKKCLLNPASHVVLPCSELSICSSCLKNSTACPSCQGPIDTTIQTYM